MYQLTNSSAENHGAAAVIITCSSREYFEEHFTKNGPTNVGKPCDQCRK